MKTIKSTFLLVLAFLVLALPSTYSFSATTSYENVLSKHFQSHFEKAKLGDSEAQYELGLCYFYGWGVKQNYTEAFKWFREAAVRGEIDALQAIGKCYMDGKGVRQSYSKAKEYFGLACDKGDDLSCDWYAKLNKKGY